MTKRFERGLVVGKFSPLHLGHEHVIGMAVDACAEMIVLSYSKPEFARCDAPTRERWLRARVPTTRVVVLDDARLAALCDSHGVVRRSLPRNDAAAEIHRAFVAWLLSDCLETSVDAVFTSEAYGDGFAASLTKHFRATDASHAAVTHVCVDAARSAYPVSGSAVRRSPSSHRAALSPEVYTDFVPRVCLLGGESTGKTTLAQALAQRLGTTGVLEYGRERWLELGGGVLDAASLLDIARTQVAREIDAAPSARGWLICDTSPLTTLVYCALDHGTVPGELRQLAARPYDLIVVCEDEFPFVQDGTRRDAQFRNQQQDMTLSLLHQSGVRFVRARGDLQRRIDTVLAHLDPHVIGGVR